MSKLNKYFYYLTILEKSNKEFDLDGIDVLLLNFIAKANDKKQRINVKDLFLAKELASKATIHGRLKKLVAKKLVVLNEDKIDGRVKEVMLTQLAHRRYELLSKAIEKAY
jgi:DNA-binding MarR family transcriptional regulator